MNKRYSILLSLTVLLCLFMYKQASAEDLTSIKERLDDIELSLSRAETGEEIAINGYFNIEYKDSDKAGVHNTFRMHHFVLFISKQIGKFRFFSETEFEDAPKHKAFTKRDFQGQVLIERVWVEYIHNDMFSLRTGVILVPTYWRVNHYPSLTPTVTRPIIDKKVFPADFVGAMASGNFYFGETGLSYALYTGNGDQGDGNQGNSDVNKNKAVGGKVTLQAPTGGSIDYLNVSVHAYADKLKGDASKGIVAEEGNSISVTGAELQLSAYPFLLLAEFASKTKNNATDDKTEGFYIQPSVNIFANTTLFYRLDTFTEDAKPSNDETRHTIGGAYHPIPDVSIKLNYAIKDFDDASIDSENLIESAFVLFF